MLSSVAGRSNDPIVFVSGAAGNRRAAPPVENRGAGRRDSDEADEMVDYSGGFWMLMTVIGVAILGAVIAYAMMRNRNMTRRQKEISEEGTRRVYAEENRDPANRGAA